MQVMRGLRHAAPPTVVSSNLIDLAQKWDSVGNTAVRKIYHITSGVSSCSLSSSLSSKYGLAEVRRISALYSEINLMLHSEIIFMICGCFYLYTNCSSLLCQSPLCILVFVHIRRAVVMRKYMQCIGIFHIKDFLRSMYSTI